MPTVRPEQQLQRNISSGSATDTTDDAFDDFSLADGLTAASLSQANPTRAPPELTVSSEGDWSIALACEAEIVNPGPASRRPIQDPRVGICQGVQRIANATRLGQAKLSGRPARYAKLDEGGSRTRYASLVSAISTAVKPLSRWVQPGEDASTDATLRQSRSSEAPGWDEDRAPAVWLEDARVSANAPFSTASASEAEPLDSESSQDHAEQSAAATDTTATATTAAAAATATAATAAAGVTAAVSGDATTAASATAELVVRLDTIKVRGDTDGREEPIHPGEPQAPQQSPHGLNGHPRKPRSHAEAKGHDEINHRLFIKLVTILFCALGLPLLIIIVFSIGTGDRRSISGTSGLSSSLSPSQRQSLLLSPPSSPPLPTMPPSPQPSQPPSPTPPPHQPPPSGPPPPNAPPPRPPAVPSPRPSHPPLPSPDQAALDSPYMNQAKCSALLSDPSSRLHQLWSTDGWRARMGGRGSPGCWEDDPDTFFANAANGTTCSRNWYEGNVGNLGWSTGGPTKDWVQPHFTDAAPALLGFDDDINWHCHSDQSDHHAHGCVRANYNILSLYHPAQYNTCRNYEWLVCAALGAIPGQRGSVMRFAPAPKDLELEGGPHPLGSCNSYHPRGCGDRGYASADIYYLEVCIFATICSNAAELFNVDEVHDWTCQVSQSGLSQLKRWLLVLDDNVR